MELLKSKLFLCLQNLPKLNYFLSFASYPNVWDGEERGSVRAMQRIDFEAIGNNIL